MTESRTQSGIDKVRSWYPKHDHLAAKVSLEKMDYHESTNTVTPELAIDSGPKVTVAVRGDKLSGGRLRNLLPIYEERSVDKDLLVEGTRDLVEYYQSQGYFDARVTYNLALPPNGDELIDYVVDKGPRHKLVKLEIEGNRYFDDDTLRERVNVIPASLIRYRHGRYSRQYLERDLDAIRDLYRGNGFRDVEVTSKEIDDYRGKTGEIAIFIEVKEGPQWFVSKAGNRRRAAGRPAAACERFFIRSKASPTAISTSPRIAIPSWIITSTTAIQPQSSSSPPTPASRTQSRGSEVHGHSRRAGLCARHSGEWPGENAEPIW